MSKKPIVIKRTLSDVKEPKSRAARVRMLLKKNYRVFKDKEKLTDFKEPVVFLRRRGGGTEIYEDSTKGIFEFTHSDGKYREIYLDPSTQGTMDYGKRKFKYYFCHEDFPLPLPEIPLVTADTVNMILEKSMMDLKKLNERKDEMKLKTIKLLAWIAAGAILLLILWKSGAINSIIEMITGKKSVPVNNVVENVSGSNALAITGNAILLMYTGAKEGTKRWLKKARNLIKDRR